MAERPKLKPTVGEKVLLHLSEYYQLRDEYLVPSQVTQKGISEAIKIKLRNVPRTLKELREQDLVHEKSCHIDGASRRYKAYFLTETGMREAYKLKESLKRHKYIDFADKLPEIKYFYGREEELETISKWLESEQGKILVISGLAGIGKTTIMTKVISNQREKRNIFFYRINEWSTLRNVATRLADFTYQMDRRTLRSYLDSTSSIDLGEMSHILSKELEGSNILLIFDDQHKMTEAIQRFLKSLKEVIETIEGTKVIVAGRYIIPFFDRRDVAIKKLVEELHLVGLDRESSEELLTTRGISNGEMTPIYSMTEGHPLFLELITSSEDLERESDIKKFLQNEVIIHLTGEERRLLEYLTVFRYPVHAKALSKEDSSYEVLSALEDKSLIQTSGSVYDLHEIIREFFNIRVIPKSKKNYHAEAAEYYLTEGGGMASIEVLYHLLMAEEYIRCSEFVNQYGQGLIHEGYIDELSGILERIPERELTPPLLIGILASKADIYEIKGKWKISLEYYRQSLNLAIENSDKSQQVILYQKMANVYESKGDYDSALDFCNRSLKLLKGDVDNVKVATAYTTMGRVYWRKGAYGDAIEQLMKGLQIVENSNMHKEIGEIYKNLGVVYWYTGNLEKAIEYCEKALKKFKNIGDVRGLASLYNNLGNVYADKGNWTESEKYYNKSLEVFEEIGNIYGIATTYGNLGVVYFDSGELDKSITYYEKSLDIRKNLGDEQGLAVIYNNIGNTFYAKNELNKAVDFYKKGLKIREKIGDAKGKITSCINLGTLYCEMGQLDESLDYSRKSLELSKELGLKEAEANAYRTYGIIYRKKEEPGKAKEYLVKSMSLLEELANPYNLGKSYCEYGRLLGEEGNLEEAKRNLEDALEIFKKLGAKKDIEYVERIIGDLG